MQEGLHDDNTADILNTRAKKKKKMERHIKAYKNFGWRLAAWEVGIHDKFIYFTM